MSIESVAPAIATEPNEYGLWLEGGSVLSVAVNPKNAGFPPSVQHLNSLNETIQGLARAAKAVMFSAENETGDTAFLVQPIEAIADAIILLSQLSSAVSNELDVESGEFVTIPVFPRSANQAPAEA